MRTFALLAFLAAYASSAKLESDEGTAEIIAATEGDAIAEAGEAIADQGDAITDALAGAAEELGD